jgi:CHAT domain-containing protein
LEALVVSGNARRPRYWLDEGITLSEIPSLTVAEEVRVRRARLGPTHGPIASISDPEFEWTPKRAPSSERSNAPMTRELGIAARTVDLTRSGWAALRGARLETEELRAAFSPESVVVLTGADASEPRVRELLSRCRLAHFATHGFVAGGRTTPLAGLALAAPEHSGDSRDDGLLQSYELGEIGMRLELAVLSACETNVGEMDAAEGAFTLARNFMAYGADQVVSTRWPIDDAVTASLMRTFFRELARNERATGKLDAAKALASAKRAVRADRHTAHPAFWAAFDTLGLP